MTWHCDSPGGVLAARVTRAVRIVCAESQYTASPVRRSRAARAIVLHTNQTAAFFAALGFLSGACVRFASGILLVQHRECEQREVLAATRATASRKSFSRKVR